MRLIIAFSLLLVYALEDYVQCFNNGLAAYNKEYYGSALIEFEKSYNLKSHSKTTYYIALCYFKIGNDSLAEKFATKANVELPKLPEIPYKQNINRILEFCELAPRFKKVKVDISLSDDEMTSAEKEAQEKMEQELKWYYPETPEGRNRLFDDFMLVQSRSLPNESELKLNMEIGQFYRDPIIDTLTP